MSISTININLNPCLIFSLLLEEEKAKKDPRYRLKARNAETKTILNELDETYKPEVMKLHTCIFVRN